MRKIAVGILVVIAFLGIAGTAAAQLMIPAADQAKEKAEVAVEKSPVISGDWALSTPGLEKIEFIHWKKGFARPVCEDGTIHPSEQCGEPGLPECPAGEVCINCKCVAEEEPAPPTACYAFLGQYGKRLLQWRELPVSYVINPDGLSETFVTSAISAGAEEWDSWTGAELFNTYTTSTGPETEYGVQNYHNAISFGDYYSDPDIIGAATVWYNPATKTIVEFDVIFETDYAWKDCESTACGVGDMDLQNIAAHELGHGAGLDDVYEVECSAVTMYGYSDYGEIQKRTLDSPDITGIRKLYGK